MRLKLFMILAAAVIAAMLSTTFPAQAHDPNVVLGGAGTATIDGVLNPGEWSNAASINFAANLSPAQGGGTTPATFFVMNDQNNLYLAVRIERPILDKTSIIVDFDNDHDGMRELGDEALLRNVDPNGSVAVFDNYRTPCQFGLCAPVDTDDGGTIDGAGAATNDGVYSVYEISHPLNSADDAHDFSLSPGDVVGFLLQIRFAGPSIAYFADPRTVKAG